MKRDESLHALSRDHHHTLMSVVLIRRHIERGVSPEALQRIAAEFVQFHKEGLLPHFRHEEEFVLPRLVRYVAEDDAMILRILTDHVALHGMVYQLGRASEHGDDLLPLLSALVDRLEAHVRFEERELFPRVEAALSVAELEEIGRALNAIPVEAVVIPGGDGTRVSPAPEGTPLDF